MGAPPAHLGEQVERAHRLGHVERLADQRGDAGGVRRAARQDVEHVLDMDHADDGIELVAIDGKAAVAGFLEQLHQLGEAGPFLDRDDVRPRHADIAGIALAEMEQVLEHLALDRGQVARRGAAALDMFVDRVLDAVAQRFFLVVTEQEGADTAPYSATFVAVSIAVATRALGHVRCSILAYQIGVVQAEVAKRGALHFLHRLGFGVVHMVIA
ncbi:conserved hypothetical protein [Ricinus communis]|uniref:Uncharacterized protein n=1 Tax=Ricinus communis TaxID=3988 RepID=B9TIG5_RICCO|nr:conserved hypothetical protein [Ricinus communis]